MTPTAAADGYLTPCIYRYVQGFASGFKNPVSVQILSMSLFSDGLCVLLMMTHRPTSLPYSGEA